MRKTVIKREVITFLAALSLVLLWGYAVIAKIAEHEKFIAQISLSPIDIIRRIGPFLGWVLPITEAILIGLLFSERWRSTGLKLSFLLLLIFECYISIMLLSGFRLPCTCGGLISKLGWKEHLVFNALFMGISLTPFPIGYLNRKNKN